MEYIFHNSSKYNWIVAKSMMKFNQRKLIWNMGIPKFIKCSKFNVKSLNQPKKPATKWKIPKIKVLMEINPINPRWWERERTSSMWKNPVVRMTPTVKNFAANAKTLELEFLNQSSVSSSSSLYGLDRWCGAVANETEISYRVPHTDPTTQFQRCDGLELAPPSS